MLHPFLMFSLSMLWGLINGLQILAYLMLFNIPIPGNILIVNLMFYEVATFDLIPLDFITDFLDQAFEGVDNNKRVSLSAQATESGYDRTNPINNLILPLFIVAVTLVIVLFLKLMSYCH